MTRPPRPRRRRRLGEPNPIAPLLALAVALSTGLARADDPAPTDSKDKDLVKGKVAAKVSVKADEPDPAKPRPIAPTGFRVRVSDAPLGEPVSAEVEIRNTGKEPIKLLGASSRCTVAGCVKAVGKYPRTLAPGESTKVGFDIVPYKLAQVGDTHKIESDVEIYVGNATGFAIPVRVRADFGTPLLVDTPSRANP